MKPKRFFFFYFLGRLLTRSRNKIQKFLDWIFLIEGSLIIVRIMIFENFSLKKYQDQCDVPSSSNQYHPIKHWTDITMSNRQPVNHYQCMIDFTTQKSSTIPQLNETYLIFHTTTTPLAHRTYPICFPRPPHSCTGRSCRQTKIMQSHLHLTTTYQPVWYHQHGINRFTFDSCNLLLIFW